MNNINDCQVQICLKLRNEVSYLNLKGECLDGVKISDVKNGISRHCSNSIRCCCVHFKWGKGKNPLPFYPKSVSMTSLTLGKQSLALNLKEKLNGRRRFFYVINGHCIIKGLSFCFCELLLLLLFHVPCSPRT